MGGLRDKGDVKPTDGGTTFLVFGDKGQSYDALKSSMSGRAFINIQENSSLFGVVIYYPDQVTQAVPIAYPYSVAMRGNNCTIKNVELLNSYDGIDATNCARFLIRNIDGQPIHRGVVVNEIYDIGRIENVHFNPWFSIGTPVFDWEMKHGIAFQFGRTDWQYVTNTFCFGYNVGYDFVAAKDGNCNGNFLGIGADDCTNAVKVDSAAPFGILITNGEFTSFHGVNPTEVVVNPSNSGVIRFNTCSFWGPSEEIAKIEGTGLVGFANCTFCQWDSHHLGLSAIDAIGGKLIVTGCEFQATGKTVSVGPGVKAAVVKDNLQP